MTAVGATAPGLRWLGAFLIACLLMLTSAARAQSGSDAAAFTSSEIASIAKLGPWPPPWQKDPSNRVSGDPRAIAFGRLLFVDAGLSPGGRFACSTCHRPERGWSDGRKTGVGITTGVRNTPGLLDVRYRRWLGWSGGGDSLWMQSLRPMLDPKEMGSSAVHVRQYIASRKDSAAAYEALFDRKPATTPAEGVLVDVAKSLAAWQETLVSPRTVFDDFRDTVTAGKPAPDTFPAAARHGLNIFIGKGRCIACHTGPAFDNGGFHDMGIAPAGRAERRDAARAGSIKALLASPYTLNGRFNDDPDRKSHWTAADLEAGRDQVRAFRVPTLRGLLGTAPYMHNGSLPTLESVVAHYGKRGLPDPAKNDRVMPLPLTASEAADLVEFLRRLSIASGS